MRRTARPVRPRVVCVPDSFKGSASAAEAAAALARGARQVFAASETIELPFADGGEGTLEALLAVWAQQPETLEVLDALGRPVTAQLGRSADGRIGILEAAQANGLPQVSDVPLQPLRADTFGVGLMARHLLEAGHRPRAGAEPGMLEEILLCIGGSASTDGGTGLLTALGVQFLDASGDPVPPGGQGLARIATVDTSGLHPRARQVRWRIAVDVDNPLIGARGAAAVFGPQKGANDDDVAALDAGLGHLAEVLAAHHSADPEHHRQAAGFGAAGGMPVGLVSLLDAEVVPGSEMVSQAVGLPEALAGADLVLTGEGSLDAQSLRGKVVDTVARHSPGRAAVVVIAGAVKLSAADCHQAGLTAALSIADGAATLEDLLHRTPELIEDAAAQACALIAHRFG